MEVGADKVEQKSVCQMEFTSQKKIKLKNWTNEWNGSDNHDHKVFWLATIYEMIEFLHKYISL